MSDFKKGDKVQSNWSTQTVHAVSDDGKHLWLMDDDGYLSTYGVDGWTVVPKFFEADKTYINASGNEVYIHHITDAKVGGSPVALAENLKSGCTLTLRPEHTMFYNV